MAGLLSHWERVWWGQIITPTVKGFKKLLRKKFSSSKQMCSRGRPETDLPLGTEPHLGSRLLYHMPSLSSQSTTIKTCCFYRLCDRDLSEPVSSRRVRKPHIHQTVGRSRKHSRHDGAVEDLVVNPLGRNTSSSQLSALLPVAEYKSICM